MKQSWYIRVESCLGYYSFYTVDGFNKEDACVLVRKQFAKDFGGTFDNCSVGYVWDRNSPSFSNQVGRGKEIDKEIIQQPLYD